MSELQASGLLVTRISAERVADELDGTRELTGLRARFSLAISAVRAMGGPGLLLVALGRELRDVRARLGALVAGQATALLSAVLLV